MKRATYFTGVRLCPETSRSAWFVRELRLVLSHTAALQLSGA
jgi:hypothetical protein